MIVTTTNNIEGYTVKRYLGVVNANVVIGTNLFSDIAASLTDVFGGRSGSYKSKLNTIYDEVMKELTEKAKSYHADAIVGLHVDFDEVSGGGKSMFMVSASGTAITLEKNIEDRYYIYDLLEKITNYKEKGIITNEEYEFEKSKILSLHKNLISEEYQKDNEEKELQKKEELQRIERINEAKELLKERTGCSIDDIEKIDEYQIQAVSYDDIDFDSNDSMQYIIAKFIRLNRIPEACKFYMEETGLEDVKSAIDFCLNVYKQIASVDTEKVAALIPKLKVLKKRGYIDQAVSEYQKLAIADKQTCINFISSLEE
ncbi:YbjQ family protein [Bacteroides caecigallinarum]|nr:YbjQ family protein [Bacteroides caecigallinarum]